MVHAYLVVTRWNIVDILPVQDFKIFGYEVSSIGNDVPIDSVTTVPNRALVVDCYTCFNNRSDVVTRFHCWHIVGMVIWDI